MSEIGDGLDHLRIAFDKIKFGSKIESEGYGTVLEGEYDDRRVALKRVNITNLADVKPKLLDEIQTISRFRQHPNLVALIGFCDEKSNEIILVYEYVSSGNLAEKMRKRLTTIQRLEICLGAARGLDYLHTGVDSTTPGIIHGDIKPSKILLNSDSTNPSKFEAKVSSFGLSNILPGRVQKFKDSIDPAFEVTGKVTKESDVYCFGVLLLEVLCGVPELVDTDDYQERHVTKLVPKRLEQNRLRKIVHFDIRKEFKTESLNTYAKIACQCVIKNPDERPSMAQVVEELEKALILQGGEVSKVQILSSEINGDEIEVVVVDDDLKEEKIENTNRNTEGLIPDVAEKNNGDENRGLGTSSEFSNGENGKANDITTGGEISQVQILGSGINGDGEIDVSVVEGNLKEDNNGGTIQPEKKLEEKIENTEKNIDSLIPDVAVENNSDQNRGLRTSLESGNDDKNEVDDITTLQGLHNSKIPESDNANGDNLPYKNDAKEGGDELQHLRIPFEKIKFGKRIEFRGYGSVFEGEYDNRQVALKRLNITNLDQIKPEILSEILTISRFRKHPNLVALIGFSDKKSNEIVLVYEYISGGNLADKMSDHLTMIQRLEICLGAARGLDYLHTGVESATPGIVHGNIELSKILLNPDSTESSKLEAKLSSFGLSKLLPGQVRKIPDLIDPVSEVTEKVTKESDVYSFGVLLLEVLCGVSELVDTDDYQERHVTEVVPKRLEQNTLRKIVHFDIRNEIKTEALETYAKIACQCVIKSPEERPTMAQVVEELEKALRLQGEEVSDIQIPASGSGGATGGTTVEDDQKDNGCNVTLDANILENEPEAKTVTTEENIDNVISDGKLAFIEGNSENEIETIDSVPILSGEESESLSEGTHFEEAQNDKVSALTITSEEPESKEEISNEKSDFVDENAGEKKIVSGTSDHSVDENTAMEITMESHNSGIAESSDNAFLNLRDTEKKPELVIELREGGFDDFKIEKLKSIGKTEESDSKRRSSTSSESSNGDGTAPSDYLLHKSPTKNSTTKKPLTGSRNCCSCGWCDCWRYFSNRIASYGELFWNKIVSLFARKHN